MLTAQDIITALDLRPLPREGGYYRETYRSAEPLPGRLRKLSTAIYYLLTKDTFSALHRLPSDELFHFYLGDPVSMLQLRPDGTGKVITLGPDILEGQAPQVVVPAGVWQGSWLESGSFALLGTTMAPGFDFTDYEAGDRAELTRTYPEFANLIARLTASAG
jgi:predicted cupin superfamily sugar epimerase